MPQRLRCSLQPRGQTQAFSPSRGGSVPPQLVARRRLFAGTALGCRGLAFATCNACAFAGTASS
eukprot:698858-Alexandrium_andersonii.AAC.1